MKKRLKRFFSKIKTHCVNRSSIYFVLKFDKISLLI